MVLNMKILDGITLGIFIVMMVIDFSSGNSSAVASDFVVCVYACRAIWL